MHKRKNVSRVWTTAAVLTLLFGCASHPSQVQPSPERATATSEQKAYPTTPAEAEALKAQGSTWSNKEIRVYYLELAGSIQGLNAQWKQEGVPAEQRAQRAYEVRHNARLTARAMMASSVEVELLRARDKVKYGHPDGPTFEELVEEQRKKGVSGDAVFEAIIDSAQQTDPKTNEKFQLEGAK